MHTAFLSFRAWFLIFSDAEVLDFRGSRAQGLWFGGVSRGFRAACTLNCTLDLGARIEPQIAYAKPQVQKGTLCSYITITIVILFINIIGTILVTCVVVVVAIIVVFVTITLVIAIGLTLLLFSLSLIVISTVHSHRSKRY